MNQFKSTEKIICPKCKQYVMAYIMDKNNKNGRCLNCLKQNVKTSKYNLNSSHK